MFGALELAGIAHLRIMDRVQYGLSLHFRIQGQGLGFACGVHL